MSALSLLTEVWMSLSTLIDEKQDYNTPLQQTFYQNMKDPMRTVRIISATFIFKLLDKFSVEKNSAAPALYKSLIYSIVENPADQAVREFYLVNFQYLFE